MLLFTLTRSRLLEGILSGKANPEADQNGIKFGININYPHLPFVL